MKALIVDDSRLAANSLVKVMSRVDARIECQVASTASEALKECMACQYDVVFLDIEMPGVNGLELARRLKVETPLTNVVFVTGYPEYALDAWNTQASGFLVKPVDDDDVRRALSLLRVPVREFEKGLFVRCFGNFEVFYQLQPVSFERQQTKELMAYLVDRKGALVTMGELTAVLWEGKPDTPSLRSQLRTLISDLRRTMERLGHPEAVVKCRGGVAIKLADDECDYYGFVRGNPTSINQYRGEYMCQYSWAEPTAALLESLIS
ncbi:MAG: response regulator [Atopobiaceae bacterium]|nr:response regulator [Atopobiaceae bacterium]